MRFLWHFHKRKAVALFLQQPKNCISESLNFGKRRYSRMDIYDNVDFNHKELERFTESAKDWATCHGVLMKDRENNALVKHAPFTLFPSPFPKHLYEEAMELQKDFHRLVQRASLDHQFIEDSLKSVIVHDEFTRRQYEIYIQALKEGAKPRLYFSIVRCDYMLNELYTGIMNGKTNNHNFSLKQIEINMIAASFGGLDSKISDLHWHMAEEMGSKSPYEKSELADQTPLQNLGVCLSRAFTEYGNDNAVVVIVVEDKELNRFDQRHLQYSFQCCRKDMHVPFLFRSLTEIHNAGELTEDKRFLLEGKEVALFYFRSGYSPQGFTCEEDWLARLMIEKSVSVKCPTMAECLIGTKKVQQVFALPGVVERFITDTGTAQRIRNTFAGLYSLDPGEEGDSAVQRALNDPSGYVLKPQREGGGNNLYDEDMVEMLQKITDPIERSQYILMERIRPPVARNFIVHPGSATPVDSDTVTELGVFGVYMSDGVEEKINEACGHLLRTKSVEHKDGGVAAGRAVLDTPYLI